MLMFLQAARSMGVVWGFSVSRVAHSLFEFFSLIQSVIEDAVSQGWHPGALKKSLLLTCTLFCAAASTFANHIGISSLVNLGHFNNSCFSSSVRTLLSEMSLITMRRSVTMRSVTMRTTNRPDEMHDTVPAVHLRTHYRISLFGNTFIPSLHDIANE
jgi:hypothetical protein